MSLLVKKLLKYCLFSLLIIGSLFVSNENTIANASVSKNIEYAKNKAEIYVNSNLKGENLVSNGNNVPVNVISKLKNGITKVMYNNNIYYIKSSQLTKIPQYYSESYGISHYTRYDMEQMLKHKNESKYSLPKVNSSSISDVTSAKDNYNNGYKGQQLDVWDSWPVTDSSGKVANIKGYHVVFGLTGNRNVTNGLSGRIGVYYQKISDYKKGIKSWKYAGLLFNNNTEGAVNKNDPTLKHETAEWSGSSIMQKNGMIRLVYTSFSGLKQWGGYGNNKQTLTTALVSLVKTKDGLVVDHNKNRDRKPIFAGDGKYYETVEQSTENHNYPIEDDHTLRDPKLIESNGHKYVVFEGNTSKFDGLPGFFTLNNKSYVGGNNKFRESQFNEFQKNPKISTDYFNTSLQTMTAYNNAAVGIIELNNDYTVKKVMKPLMAFNLVDDETERPSIVQHNGKWYLFISMHGWHLSSTNVDPNASFMLGFYSNKLTSGYKPLNKYGLVLYSNDNLKSRTYNYSYNVNQSDNNPFVLNFYMTQLDNGTDQHSTFAPSVLLNINNDNTNIIKKPVLQQGQIVYKK